MPDGGVQYHYDGIQVRKVPLPLRVPPSAQSQSPQPQILKTLPNKQPQTHANNNIQPQQPSQRLQFPSAPVSTTTVTSTTPASPGSPILTHLLHRKNEAPTVDPKVKFDFIQDSWKDYLFKISLRWCINRAIERKWSIVSPRKMLKRGIFWLKHEV